MRRNSKISGDFLVKGVLRVWALPPRFKRGFAVAGAPSPVGRGRLDGKIVVKRVRLVACGDLGKMIT